METEKVIILPVVYDYLFDLIKTLYDKEYFAFEDSTKNYVNGIVDFMYTLPDLKAKVASKDKFGKYYCTFKANNNTSWYIVFDVEDNVYLIKFITNNHSHYYPTYIRGLK
jgi:hypothetical protein